MKNFFKNITGDEEREDVKLFKDSFQILSDLDKDKSSRLNLE